MVRTYIRCSTDEQANSRLGLEAQSGALRLAAEARGWTVDREYVDAGHTGAHLRRPALGRLLHQVRRGDVVMFLRLDRISRSVADFGTLVDRSRASGWSIVCLDPDLDLTTPNGELVANILVSVAQWERRMTSQRTREALAARRARGLPVGSIPQTPVDVERRILELHAEGATLTTICALLDADLVPTVRGGPWQPSTVSKVIRRANPPA